MAIASRAFVPFAPVPVFASLESGSLSLPNRQSSKLRDGGVGSAVCLNRILFERSEVSPDGTVHLAASDMRATHVRDVLRVPTTTTNNNNADPCGRVRAGILSITGDDNDMGRLFDDVQTTVCVDGGVKFSLGDAVEKNTIIILPSTNLTLMLAMPRPKVLARLLPQIAAVGVRHLALVNAYRVERCYFDSFLVRRENELRSALVTGLMQAGNDARVPNITVAKRLRVFLEDDLPNIAPAHRTTRIVAHPAKNYTNNSHHESLLNRLNTNNTYEKRNGVCLAIGPEGGWMDREISMLQSHGFQTANLGERVLRTDAAVLILMGIVHEFWRGQAVSLD